MGELPQPRERRMQVRGLLWLAAIVLAATLFRAAHHHLFAHDWWRLW